MRRTKRKSKGRRGIRLLFLVVAVWLGFTFGKGFIRQHQLRQDYARIQQEIRAIELRNEQLRMEIARLQSPEYVERVAREELGLVKPGETLYILSQPLPEGAGVQVEKRTSSNARD